MKPKAGLFTRLMEPLVWRVVLMALWYAKEVAEEMAKTTPMYQIADQKRDSGLMDYVLIKQLKPTGYVFSACALGLPGDLKTLVEDAALGAWVRLVLKAEWAKREKQKGNNGQRTEA